MRTGAQETAAQPHEVDERVVRALSHPLRHAVLYLLTERSATARELVDLTRHKPRDIAYHLRVLEECEAVERVSAPGDAGETPLFRATVRPIVLDDAWGQVPLRVRRRILGNALDVVGDHAASALAGGGFDRADSHLSWTPLDLDEQAYSEVVALLGEALDRMLAIRAGAAERRDRGETSASIPSEVVFLHFLRDPQATAATAGTPQPGTDVLERIYSLLEEIGEEVPQRHVRWHHVAERASELTALARQSAAAAAARR